MFLFVIYFSEWNVTLGMGLIMSDLFTQGTSERVECMQMRELS